MEIVFPQEVVVTEVEQVLVHRGFQFWKKSNKYHFFILIFFHVNFFVNFLMFKSVKLTLKSANLKPVFKRMLSTQQNLQIIPKSEAIRESGIAKPVYFHGECFKRQKLIHA